MEYLIRDFRETDIFSLITLCEKHALWENTVYDPESKAALLKKALLSPTPVLHCWIVVADGESCGYATFTFDFSTWDAGYYLHLDCLFVEEKFRGLGIGREIVRRLSVVAKKKNCINLQWQTPVFNKQAIRFYERIGGKARDKKRFVLSVSKLNE